jgi:uncharacterized protein YdbL (DUF1318 family)
MTLVEPSSRLTTPLLALVLAGCLAVTVNVTFPQEQLDNAASNIEDLVRNPVQAPKPGGASPAKPTGRAVPSPASWLRPAAAEAQVPELKTHTAEVEAAIQSRRSRYPELSAAAARGCVGENNQGLVERRAGTECPASTDRLIADENRDRMFLYRTLVQQNNMPAGDLGRVQAAFAKANRERAPAGAWVQDDAGQWVRK